MQLDVPPPFNASNNPHRTTPADPYLQYPYDCCGPFDRWTYPCRGHLDLLGTLEGAPTATWETGSTQSWNISGIGNRYGGNCQVGFGVDEGKTFRVATSYEGNCPHRSNVDGPEGQDFALTVPNDLETGVQVFAWVWYNREQEFNMNCAAVNITASSIEQLSLGSRYLHKRGNIKRATSTIASPSTPTYHVAFTNRPLLLIADDGNGCVTGKTAAELKYPDPGPDLVTGDGVYPLELPIGNCNAPGTQTYDGSRGEDGHSV